jgi:hypothetical protein
MWLRKKKMSICDDYFINHGWQLSRADGLISAPVIRFRDHGIVGGFLSKWERCWELRGSSLLLQDISGATTTRFEISEEDEHGVLQMRGRSLVWPSVEHVLTRIEMPSLEDTSVDSGPRLAAIGTIRTSDKIQRPNLVIIRAGHKSLHRQWPAFIDKEDRNWDLCVSWYENDLPVDIEDSEHFFHQPEGRKFSAVADLLTKYPKLMEYENFWLPDDDLEISWRDINRMFNIFRRMRLELAQPALTSSSHSFVNHLVTAQDPNYFLRFCDFVELMCPLFSRELIELCLPAFRGTVMAFCLDHIWGGLQGRVPGRTAIIDDVAVAHTRPMGANYDPVVAMDEGNRLSSLYRIAGSYTATGGIRKEDGVFL